MAAPLARFVALYALMYPSFGVSSPFLPRFLESRGLTPEQIGIFFGLGTTVRLLSVPVAGRIADLSGALRTALALCILPATGVGVALLYAEGFGAFLLVSVAHAAVLAPTTTLADALAVEAAVPRGGYRGFEYGWVRGAASGAFVLGSLVAGQVLATAPLDTIVSMHAALLGLAGFIVPLVPPLDAPARATPQERSPVGGVREEDQVRRPRPQTADDPEHPDTSFLPAHGPHMTRRSTGIKNEDRCRNGSEDHSVMTRENPPG